MSVRIPPNFNADRYAAAYPDVALSGLDALEHYRRFGKAMGRDPAGRSIAAKAVTATPQPAAGPATEPQLKAPSAEHATASNKLGPVAPAGRPPILERPADFETGEIIPAPAPARTAGGTGDMLSLEDLAQSRFSSEEDRDRLCGPLIAYARTFSLEEPAVLTDAATGDLCAAAVFQRNDIRIQNAWFADSSALRLAIAVDSDGRAKGWVIRAYQARPGSPGHLGMAGRGIQLPALGPVYYDIELADRLMPILLELTDPQNVTRGFCLLPFPSLLPGGLHAAELRALQNEANPMDAFWTLSEMLLRENRGQPGWSARSIAGLSLHSTSGTDVEPSFSREVEEWLTSVFKLPVFEKSEKTPKNITLVLPANSVPTISALVSRRLEVAGATRISGPYLVANESNFHPRWSVVVPPDHEAVPHIPVLQMGGRKSRTEGGPRPVPVPLAICLRPESNTVTPSKPRSDAPAKVTYQCPPATIILDATDPQRTETALSTLKDLVSAHTEFLVRLPEPEGPARSVLDAVLGGDHWAEVPKNADLRELGARARHPVILTLSDRVQFDDQRPLETILELLEDGAASASCILLSEAIFKKQKVYQHASGGLFPGRVSFASSPRLAFFEPDVQQALPDMTYPVVANTMLFTAWRAAALAKLPQLTGPVPATAADIRIGLDLMDAGCRSVCTSKVSARVCGPYLPRDTIDPVGSMYVQPGRWEGILSRVTVLRELF